LAVPSGSVAEAPLPWRERGFRPGLSMIEHEFPRIQQGPEGVLQRLLLVRLRRPEGVELLQLLRRGLAAETADVQLVEDLGRRLLFRQPAADQGALGDARR